MNILKYGVFFLSMNLNAQTTWQKGGNSAAGGISTIGTNYNSPLIIRTNSLNTALFSNNSGLNGFTGTGDGLRILNQNPNPNIPVGWGQIDIFTGRTDLVANATEKSFGLSD